MSRYIALALSACALALPASAADRKFDAEACAKAVTPYLDDRTVAVLHVDLTAVDVNALASKAAAVAKVNADALPFPRQEAAAGVKALTDAGARDLYFVVSLADVPEQLPFVVAPVEKDAKPKELAAALDQYIPYGANHYAQVGEALVGADAVTLKRLREQKPVPSPDLGKAFAAAGDGLAQLAVLPPKDAGKVIEAVMPTLPAEVGGGSSQVLSHGFRWAAAGVDAPKLRLGVTVQVADADSAKALLDLLKKTYAAVGKDKQVREGLPTFDKLAELLTPKIADDRLTLSLDEEALAPALGPLLAKTLEAAGREESATRLRQLSIAAMNYMDTYGAYPAAYNADKNAKPLLSWRVHLLPFLAQADLYKEFHLDEPWDSEHNKKLIARMPAVFRSTTDPKLAAEGKTAYLAPVGDATMFPGPRGVRIAEVTDGTSTTILFVHADDDHAVTWTKPDDLAYDPNDPTKGLSGGFSAVFADGAVHFLPKTLDKATLQALFTRNGGEVVTPP